MDKKNALLNIFFSVMFNILLIIVNFIAKKLLIYFCGDVTNGFYSLLLDIVDFFTLFEAGVGSAILFAMYTPIVNRDYKQLYSLYLFFKKIYFIIFLIISILGLLFTPFIFFFIKDLALDYNPYIAYVIVLLSISTTHLYSYKTSIFNAEKKNYVVTIINISCQILMRGIQIVLLYFTRNFIIFLSVRFINNLLLAIIYYFIEKKKIKPLFKNLVHEDLTENEKHEINKNVKAIAKYKIGTVLGNTLDSVIISLFINVVTLGFFSNYKMLAATAFSILQMIFTSLNAVIGHKLLTCELVEKRRTFNKLQQLNFLVGFIAFVGLYSIINDVITIWLGSEYILGDFVVSVIVFNYFVQYTLLATRVVKESAGLFYFDRNLSIIEGIINLGLSLLLVNFLGVSGVLIATIITNLLFAHIVEPLILFKKYLGLVDKKYYVDKAIQMSVFVLTLFLMRFIHISVNSIYLQLLINGCTSILVTVTLSFVYFMLQPDLRSLLVKKR